MKKPLATYKSTVNFIAVYAHMLFNNIDMIGVNSNTTNHVFLDTTNSSKNMFTTSYKPTDQLVEDQNLYQFSDIPADVFKAYDIASTCYDQFDATFDVEDGFVNLYASSQLDPNAFGNCIDIITEVEQGFISEVEAYENINITGTTISYVYKFNITYKDGDTVTISTDFGHHLLYSFKSLTVLLNSYCDINNIKPQLQEHKDVNLNKHSSYYTKIKTYSFN